jgi:hypothetical protein
MPYSQAAVSAVLSTLLRATVDDRLHVVLRTRYTAQASELAHWLSLAHGSTRTVVPSATLRGEIEVRLPRQMRWPPLAPEWAGRRPLALRESESHLSTMTSPSPSAGIP